MERIRGWIALEMALLLFFGAVLWEGQPVKAAVETADVMINEANFPDQHFRKYVTEMFDANGNGYLSRSERDKAMTIDIVGASVNSLKGVEYFEQLKNLSCENNLLTDINVSGNEELDYLDCSGNKLTELKVGENQKLTTLYCWNNQLAELDISKNPLLQVLNCSRNLIEKLDTGKNPALTTLICDENHLSSLNLNMNTRLEVITCSKNWLTSIDISALAMANPSFAAADNRYSIGSLAENRFDLSALEPMGFKLDKVYSGSWKGASIKGSVLYNFASDYVTYDYDCGKGKRVTFNLSVGIPITEVYFPDPNFRRCLQEENVPLKDRRYDRDGDGSLSVSELARITEMDVSGKDIRDLTGIGYFTSLKSLKCRDNLLKSLDLTGLAKLESLDCSENQLKSLSLKSNTGLKSLFCQNNRLAELDLTGLAKLESLDCSENQLKSLSLKSNTGLKSLSCQSNQLAALDLTGLAKLESLDCSENQLKSLPVKSSTGLKSLSCQNNQLAALDLTGLAKLESLDCSENQLKSLLLDDCDGLKSLNCENNQLKTLGLSACDGLTGLKCGKNYLVALELGGCDALSRENVDASGNVRDIGDVADTKSYDLSKLREDGFVLERASAWNGAEEEKGTLSAFQNTEITYSYDCGRGIGETFKLTISRLPHIHQYVETVVEPTCTEKGYTEHVCSGCGERYIDNETPALGHQYVETVVKPTCTEKGYTEHVCSVCGHRYTDSETPALGHQYVETVVEPTCTEKGYTEHVCSVCGHRYTDSETAALGHQYRTFKTAAAWRKDGTEKTICSRCKAVKAVKTIRGIGAVYLVKTVYVYDGVKKKPPVMVKDMDNRVISSSFYRVSYQDNINVGTGSAVISFYGDYTGTMSLYFTINPMRTKITKTKSYSGKLRVTWQKREKQVTGYELQYAPSADFDAAKTLTLSYTLNKKTIGKLKKKKSYYLRVRSYTQSGGKTYYSAWSPTVKAKTRK